MHEWLEKLKNKKSSLWLVGLITGLLLLVISIPAKETSVPGLEKESETTGSQMQEEDAYVQTLEKRLQKLLSGVDGVGKAEVMITLQSDGERLVEKDSRNVEEESRSEKEDTTVFEQAADGSQTPYVLQQRMPQIEGVLVSAEGGGNPLVVKNITEAVHALFGVEVHKIKVMKKV